ncbi:hypothetical protein [Bacillus changyiensis]|uniref:hypothetical protein n=1 Tax=Bacillus changyiensis TaxID=3004103 RepID=UPI0022E771CE|nr:hypothetical protein [Bacillus changyiensis]MDA1477481.1 hypothetical protein [Bacillus changyiensis]
MSPEREKILDNVHEKWSFDLHKEVFVARVILEKNLVGNTTTIFYHVHGVHKSVGSIDSFVDEIVNQERTYKTYE